MAAIAADRHLLFGLLALQNGLIHQAQLVAAFQAWTLEKSRPLADHLVALGHLSPAQRSVVEALAALHLQAHGGEVEKSLAAVPAGKSTLESLAAVQDPDIERTLSRVGSARPPADDGDADRTASYAIGSATSDGQRFRILRPHARGGLGAVFVALDTELHREVAMKQILDQHADDPTNRARFVLEAEITGGLEHPGIVPVYGLGTYDGGRPYYAMRFIKGDSLKEAADRFHADEALKRDPGRRALELRKLLRRFTDVCDAIGYAHARGVLHRDIKPGNIIVGKYGETLVVDWGLAKATGRPDPGADPGERTLIPSSASGSAETLPGSALGTPAYMSPEQAERDIEHLGPRSDVYSLGATLYYLLTGRPPVEGEIGDILRAVHRGDVRPPRECDATIDAALEAVCLKAMAHRPTDRYASPRALSEDIERWMADEPVSAWREPLGRRARRWANRNRTAMATAAVALVAGVVGLSAVLVVQNGAKAEVIRALGRERVANQSLAAANGDLERSKVAVQARYDLAVEAIQAFHTGVSEDFLLKQESFKELRDRLLRSAQEFYGKLSALLGRETDAAARRALLASNYALAHLTGEVGGQDDALKAHRAVLAGREALASEPGAEVAATMDVCQSLTAVATLLEAIGQTDEALATYRRSESLLSGPAGTDRSARAALASCRSQLGVLLSSTDQTTDALAAYRRALADQEVLAAAPGAPAAAGRDLADTIIRIGLLLSRTGRAMEAEAEYRRALVIHRKLAADHPAVPDFRSRLGTGHNDLGGLLSDTGRATEAETEFRRALEIYGKLAADHPAVPDFRSRLAGSRVGLGWLLSQTGKPAEAEAEYRAALSLFRKLADEHPRVPYYRDRAANLDNNLSVVLRRLGRPAEARDHAERAVAAREVLVREDPRTTGYREGLAENLLNRGLARRALGDPAGAAADLRRALGLYDALPSRSGEECFLFACCHAALAGLAGRESSGVSAAEADAAMTLLHKAVGVGYRNPDAYRTEDALDPLRGRDDFRLLMLDLAFPAEAFAR
jgi:serine/threonine protein kinase/tetratricopeptide (TPR) repeat protein